MVKAPASSETVANPDGWAAERRLTALDLVEQGKFKTAYAIVSTHGDLSQKPLWDAEFFSGFLALRFLKEPKAALRHFIASRKAAELSSEKSQAAYWIARTEDVLGHADKARAAYQDAAHDNTVFYGQLAQQFLSPKSQNLVLGAPHIPSAADARAFTSLDAMRAGVIVDRAGLPDVARLFFAHLRENLKDDAQFTLLAHYAYKSGDTPMTLRAGRKGMQHGHDLAVYAYPTYALPSFKPLRTLPEYSIFYAIARQESEFSPKVVSGAGARGVLQLMPATARSVCSQYKVKCEITRLTSDPSYNVSLATAYIADRHDDFAGSYILALAGYNAGPGRAREWIKALGDPRSPKVDPIDWIEQIPLPETRDYVKKVLANIQVYRALLGDPATALRVREDLVRARFPS